MSEKSSKVVFEYFVVEVLSSETVYDPVAEYRYVVKPLGNISKLTDKSFPTHFSTDIVLSSETVGAGYWVLAKINRRTGQVYTVDVTKPEIGFADSPYFLQVFYDRLEDAMDPVRETLIKGYKNARLKVRLAVADDFSIQAKFNQPKNNLALVAVDYYVDTIIHDFSPFFSRYAELNFDVTLSLNEVVVRHLKYGEANHFFYQAIDESENLPSVFRSRLGYRTDSIR